MTEKKPDFSNVVGGSSSTAEAPTSTGSAAPRTYVVQKGDSLSKIATTFYGDAKSWRLIFEANRDRIKDPDLIQPGWKLAIPEGQAQAQAQTQTDDGQGGNKAGVA